MPLVKELGAGVRIYATSILRGLRDCLPWRMLASTAKSKCGSV